MKDDGENKISYHSEWLGYLPYGQYHWVAVNGKDVTSLISNPDTMAPDLEKLVKLKFIVKVKSQVTTLGGNFATDEIYNEYQLVMDHR